MISSFISRTLIIIVLLFSPILICTDNQTSIDINKQKESQEEIFQIWNNELKEFIDNRTASDSSLEAASKTFNKFQSWENCTEENKTYYLFLIQTKVNITQEIELKTYLGLCLPTHEVTPLELLNLTYTSLWDYANLVHSVITDIEEPFNQERGYPFRAIFISLLLFGYLMFCLYAAKFPKNLNYKTNSEMEKIQERIEIDKKNRLLDDNDEMEDNEKNKKFDFTEKLTYNSLYTGNSSISKNSSLNNKLTVQKDGNEERKERKLFYHQIYNSFNLVQNIKLQFTNFSPSNPDNDLDLHLAISLRSIAYIWVAFYTVIPVIFKVPISNPESLIANSNTFLGQLVYNSHFIYNMAFGMNGFIVAYIYYKNKKHFNLNYVFWEIVFKIAEVYFIIISIFLIFWQLFILFNDGPISRYLYGYECDSCSNQMLNIFLLIANYTYGLYERFFPFCIYHSWMVFTELHYFICSILLVWLFTKFKSLFYILFMLIIFNILILHIMTLSITQVSITYLDIIYRNIKPFYGKFGLKFITRAGPYLFGFFFSLSHLDRDVNKDNNWVSYIQKHSIIFLSLGFGVFWLTYYMQFLLSNHYIPNTEVIGWFYWLSKHDLFTIGFLVATIALMSNHKICIKIKNFFNLKLFHFLEKTSLTSYLLMSVIARGLLYRYNDKTNMTNLQLMLTFIILWVLTTIFSILFTALFQIPAMRIGIIIKSRYEEKIKSKSLSITLNSSYNGSVKK